MMCCNPLGSPDGWLRAVKLSVDLGTSNDDHEMTIVRVMRMLMRMRFVRMLMLLRIMRMLLRM